MLSRGGCNEHPIYSIVWGESNEQRSLYIHQHGETPLMIKVEHVAAHGDEAIVMSGVVGALSIIFMDKGNGMRISCHKEDCSA